ncbi:integral membrane protein DUF106-domain-containing protein [Endogone sp. FLAS-F59071]|nr:integral membrane protein DUF106-domain-containing protein [Endogone sp. FLAS-F59071]|eukprot:RUS15743.1 integral membrane protein DUF106-domain-containing protein [Endogone sp. FLAS-F59071]
MASVAEVQQMILDPAIRDWVLIPIMIVMLLLGVLRHYITVLISSPPKKPSLKSVRESKILLRGMQLRTYGNTLPAHAFQSRKQFLSEAYESGSYLKNPKPTTDPDVSALQNPMPDPDTMETMMAGMKGQVGNMIPQMLIMGWINFFFQGFVLIRLPFPLTLRFKSMLQRGVETQDMDVAWVSSLSWYFLNLFGLGSIFQIILGDGNAAGGMNDVAAMGTMVPGGMPGAAQATPTGPVDFSKLHLAEKENLELTQHEYELDDVEERVLIKYNKRAPRVSKVEGAPSEKDARVEAIVPGVKEEKKNGTYSNYKME